MCRLIFVFIVTELFGCVVICLIKQLLDAQNINLQLQDVETISQSKLNDCINLYIPYTLVLLMYFLNIHILVVFQRQSDDSFTVLG